MVTVEMLRPVFRAAWGPDTCDPHDLANWRPENPARGQCGTTALVVHHLLGGELLLGEVYADGAKVGHHWWNRLPNGVTVDLTADQFHPGESVVGAARSGAGHLTRPSAAVASMSCCVTGCSVLWQAGAQSRGPGSQ